MTRLVKSTLLAITAIAALGLAALTDAPADEADAKRILKEMSDYVSSQKSLSVKYDVDLEVITPTVEKIQFSSSGEVLLSRPDKIRMARTGGYADVEMTFDGKTLTIYGKHNKTFAQIEAPGSLDQLIDQLRQKHGVEMPGADLLLAEPYEVLMEDVLEAKYIGHGVVDGIECEHLAFRNFDTDWQLWVELGNRPIPRKYVITTKTLAAAPQYTLRIKEWKTDVAPDADAFTFKKPDGVQLVAFEALKDIDELPVPAETQGRK